MGTQQILMIILSVIVVGAAIAVGIQMFDTQSRNQARVALTAELMQVGTQCQAWWRTPVIMGGASGGLAADQTMAKLMEFVNKGQPGLSYTNAHGIFTITSLTPATPQCVFTAVSASNASIKLTMTCDLSGGAPDDPRAGIVITDTP